MGGNSYFGCFLVHELKVLNPNRLLKIQKVILHILCLENQRTVFCCILFVRGCVLLWSCGAALDVLFLFNKLIKVINAQVLVFSTDSKDVCL